MLTSRQRALPARVIILQRAVNGIRVVEVAVGKAFLRETLVSVALDARVPDVAIPLRLHLAGT